MEKNITNNKNIIDVDEANFNEKIIKASSEKLILVDFWAPWCGPCKQLTPVLEKIIDKCNDKVVLAKVNIDDNKQIAGQLNIQSIPAVFAFKESQVVDAFQGIIPENKIIEFIEKNLGEKIKEDFSDYYLKIETYLNEDKLDDAKESLEEFISQNSQELKVSSLYIKTLILLKKDKEASDYIDSLNEEILEDESIKKLIQQIEIKKKHKNGPSLEEIKKIYNNDPKKILNIISLADKYFIENLYDESFELLIQNYNKDKAKIKIKMLEFFEILGNDSEKTKIYRKKLSSIMFV